VFIAFNAVEKISTNRNINLYGSGW